MNDQSIEIKFEVFWSKWNDIKPGIYDKKLSEQEWYLLSEKQRYTALLGLSMNHPIIESISEPFMYLIYFELPF